MMPRSLLELFFTITCTIILSACQSITSQPEISKPIEKSTEQVPEGIKIIPYEHPEIKRESMPIIVPKQPI